MGDWSSAIYIASQCLVVLGFCCLGATYLVKTRWLVLTIVISSNVILGAAYGMLAAWVGLGMCALAIVRDVVGQILVKYGLASETKITRLDCALLVLWLGALATITAFTFDTIWDWAGACATALFTVSIWQKSKLIYDIMGIFVGAFWVTYNVMPSA